MPTKSYKDGSFYLNIIPDDNQYCLTSCVWDAETEIEHGGGQVLMYGTFAECEKAVKTLFTLDAINRALQP